MPSYTCHAEGQFPHGGTFMNAKAARDYARDIAIARRVSVAVYNWPAGKLLGEFNRYGERTDKGL